MAIQLTPTVPKRQIKRRILSITTEGFQDAWKNQKGKHFPEETRYGNRKDRSAARTNILKSPILEGYIRLLQAHFDTRLTLAYSTLKRGTK